MQISEIIKGYGKKLDFLDLEIIIANSLGKPREFVLAHPEYKLVKSRKSKVIKNIKKRMRGEPIAYITGHKEFYGLDFIVNENTLIPRPETELLVESVIKEMRDTRYAIRDTFVIDVGTGSGNIIVSVAKNLCHSEHSEESRTNTHDFLSNGVLHCVQDDNTTYFATDVSKKALTAAKKNAKIHKVDGKIKFLHGNLLDPILKTKKLKIDKLIVLANLPYLSKKIYSSAPVDVKKYEPKSALYSPEQGLQHYKRLLLQIKKLPITDYRLPIAVFLEISPEQKQPTTKLIKNIFPEAKISFEKDLARKWRVCKICI